MLRAKQVARKRWDGKAEFYREDDQTIEVDGKQFKEHLNKIESTRNKKIVKEYLNQKASVKELAKKYDLNDQYTRKIIKKELLNIAEELDIKPVEDEDEEEEDDDEKVKIAPDKYEEFSFKKDDGPGPGENPNKIACPNCGQIKSEYVWRENNNYECNKCGAKIPREKREAEA